MKEEDWRAWKEKTFGTEYMIWHDGLYVGCVQDLKGKEREDALAMLRFGLSLGDAHAAEALAAMADRETIDSMRTQLAKSEGADRVRIALAIHAVEPEPKLAEHLVAVLKSNAFWSVRIDAAMGLRHFSGPADELALLESVEKDPDYLVRNHCCDSLLIRWKITPSGVSDHPDIFRKIIGDDPKPEDFARFKEARAMMEKLKAR